MTPPTSRNEETYNMILTAISEVKTIVSGLDDRVRQLERAMVEQSVTAAQRLDAAFRKIDEHSSNLREIENDLACRVRERIETTGDLDRRLREVENVSRFAKWLGVAVGGLLITLIWGILTHTITIAMP